MLKKSFLYIAINVLLFLCCSSNAASGEDCFLNPSNCHLSTNKQDILELTKYLYEQGVIKNNGNAIKSGTFVIEDPGFKLLNELLIFAKNTYGSLNCGEVYITNKSAYPRKSTHFVEVYLNKKQAQKNFFGILNKLGCDVVHYGIDFAKGELPMANKQHLLFGKIGTINEVPGKSADLIFIRMEEAGLSGLDAIKHTFDLIKTNAARMWPTLVSSLKGKLGLKDTTLRGLEVDLQELYDSISTDSGNELVQTRKERIPMQIMAYYLALAQDVLQKGDSRYENMKMLAKTYGIQYMIYSMETLKNYPEAEAYKTKIDEFIANLKKQYPEDYLHRFGNEIILTRPKN